METAGASAPGGADVTATTAPPQPAQQVIPNQPAFQPSASPANVQDALDYNAPGESPQADTGTLTYGQPSRTIPNGIIPHKAAKYDFAFGDKSPGVDTLSARLTNGEDPQIRNDMMQQKDLQLQQTKLRVLNNLLANSPNGVSDEDAQVVMEMNKTQVNQLGDPDTIMETEFGRKYIAHIATRDPQQNFQTAEAQAPEATHQVLDRAEYGVARNQIVNNRLEEVQSQIKDQSWGGYLADQFMANVVPLANIRLRNLAESPSVTALIPGNNLEEQVEYMHTLDPVQFNQTLNKALTGLGSNLQLKQQFLQALVSYSDSDRVMSGLQTAADVATVGEAGVKLGSLMKAAVTASKDTALDAAKIAGTTGDFKSAAVLNAERQSAGVTGEATTAAGEDNLRQNALSINGGGARWLTGDPANLSREAEQRFLAQANKNQSLAGQFLNETDRVDRTSLDQRIATRQALYDDLTANLGRKPIGSNVLDIDANGGLTHEVTDTSGPGGTNVRTGTKFQTSYNPLTNTEQMQITFGKDNGEMFANQAAAQKWADTRLQRFDSSAKSIEPVAGQWVVRLRQDLPDTIEGQRALSIPTDDQFATNPLNAVLGRFREQSAILGDANFQARMQVTHGNQRLYNLFQDMLGPMADLNKQERGRLIPILEANRDFVDPVTGNRGQFFATRGDFENAYRAKWGQLPSDKDLTAYYSYVQANDLDGMVRNASVARDKIRANIKNVSDKLTVDDPTKAANDPQAKSSIKFEGKKVDSIPFGDGNNTSIAVRDPKTGKVKFVWKESASAKQKEMIDNILQKGGTAWQAWDGHVEVPGSGGRAVSHYISGTAQEGRIDINGFWKPGGHVVYEDSHYIKQPIARGEFYAGDRAVATAPNAKVAAQRAEAYEQARQMMLRNDPALDDFVSKNIGLGMDAKSFRQMFERTTSDGKDIPGLDPNQPFRWTAKGQRIGDKYPLDNLKMRENPYNIANYDRAFAGERDARNIPALIDEAGVRHVHEDGHLLDPFQSMQNAARTMVDTTLKRDYIVKSARQFVQQFADVLDVSKNNPAFRAQWLNDHFMDVFYNPEYLKGADKGVIQSAENVRNTILRQAATPTWQESQWETAKAKLAEYTYGKVGDKAYNKIADNWAVAMLKDPLQTARAIAFNTKIAWSIPELFLQAQSAVNVLSIAPKAGLKGVAAYTPARLAILNPNLLDHSASVAAKFGWKEADFKQMLESMQRSGWLLSHGSTSVMDDIANPTMFTSKAGQVLHFGQTLFDEGIKVHRISGYATAWQEWLADHPTMTREGLNWVLQRANTLTGNMSAASNAVWQRGVFAVPAQFWTYQMRLMEQYFSNQLGAAEKARLFAGQALMYGLPVAAGGAVGVWPIAQSVKESLVENNIPHTDGAISAVIGGLPQFLIKLATGSQFDVGEKLGQGGLDVARKWYRGDESVWKLLGGASGSTLTDMAQTMIPGFYGLMSALDVSPYKDLYKLDIPTIERAFDNVSGVGGAIKMGYAMETGKWMTKYGTYLDNATPFEALFSFLTGAQMSSINDAYARQEALGDHHALANSAAKDVQDYYRRALNETEDTKQRDEYFRMAQAHAVMGGLTPQEMEKSLRAALAGIDESKVDSMQRALEMDSAKRSYLSNEEQ